MHKNSSKILKLIAPMSGKIIPLDQVPDSTFAQKIAGDGAAIIPEDDYVLAPIAGKLVFIFRTNHAFAVRNEAGITVMVHIGIDTVELEGKGFERIAEEGTLIKAGDPVIKIDRAMLSTTGKSLISPVLITDMDDIESLIITEAERVEAGKDVLATLKIK